MIDDLWEEVSNTLGFNNPNMQRDRPYTGQPQTSTGERGKTEIKGVTFRDLRDCFIRAYCLSDGIDHPDLYEQATRGENALLCENDIYKLGDVDPMAVFQNLSLEIERLMGIYPNVPKLKIKKEAK